MNHDHLFRYLCLTALLALFAVGAQAQTLPTITVTPTEAGPIDCDSSVEFTVSYDPNDYEGELQGFSIEVANGDFDYATFEAADIANAGWPGQFFKDTDGPNLVSVDGAIFGDEFVTTATDLFTVTLHGADTGLAELQLLNITLRDPATQSIDLEPVVNPVATIEVDCTPPDVPEMMAEPVYTPGTENTVAWTAVTDPNGPVEYNVVCSNGDASGWITETTFPFTGLEHGELYTYEVQARDFLGNESIFSDPVESTQDAVAPESAAGPLDPAYGVLTFDVPWTGSDDLSGLQYIQLFYRVDGGAWIAFGTTFNTNPIEFTAPGDGEYEFYTLATDEAGNSEVDPEADSVSTIVDTTAPEQPVMDTEPDFTAGTENTVSWAALDDTVEYRVYCDNGDSSWWITDTSYTFTGLTDGELYEYWVVARDALENVSDPSDPVGSTQDDSDPESQMVAPPTGNIATRTFDVEVTYSDATSGVQTIRLFYNQDGTTWTQFGTGFPATGSPLTIPFEAPDDGEFAFYSIAVDAVGNVEAAPLDADIVLTVDTAGPQGTFVINQDAEYTTSADVTLNIEMTDANGVANMRFKDDEDVWSEWAPYGEDAAWSLFGDDGVKTVTAEFEDGTGQTSTWVDTIILDTTPPAAPITSWGGVVQPGHESVTITWTEPEEDDLATVEIWAALWDDVQDSVGVSVYPEFDDIAYLPAGDNDGDGTAEFPTIEEHLDPDPDYFLLAEVPAGGDGTYVHTGDSPWARAGFRYFLYLKDQAGNYSQAHNQWGSNCINYILGDFNADGEVTIGADVTGFAASYGAAEGEDGYDPIYDIGPASGPAPWYFYPQTDNDIEFEDLMVLSQTYNNQGGAKAAPTSPTEPMLAWYQVDETTWAMGVSEACNSLTGLRLSSALPEGVTVQLAANAELLAGTQHLLLNDARHGLDVGFAILDAQTVPGTGELFRVTTSEPVDLSQVQVAARDAANQELAFKMSSEPLVTVPSAYSLEGNFPNPFNPQTTIKFSLPEAQAVRLEVFDIRGRRVRVLVDENMAAGSHSVIWDGRDGYGRGMASGTYFYRVDAGPLQDTRRMLLVK